MESRQAYMEAVRQACSPIPQFIAIKKDTLAISLGVAPSKKLCGRTLDGHTRDERSHVEPDLRWAYFQLALIHRGWARIMTYSTVTVVKVLHHMPFRPFACVTGCRIPRLAP